MPWRGLGRDCRGARALAEKVDLTLDSIDVEVRFQAGDIRKHIISAQDLLAQGCDIHWG